MHTIAVIGSLDTKSSELTYMIDTIHELGMQAVLYDTSGLEHTIACPKADVTNTSIVEAGGSSWKAMESMSKNERLGIVTNGLKRRLREDYDRGVFQGVLSAGGMQNTLMAKTAMNELPYGVPKVNVVPSTTMVEIDDAIGRLDDVTTVNSIADIGGGINVITAAIIRNGIATLKGQLEYGSGRLQGNGKPLIGIMNLGVTAKGASRAAELLKEKGCEPCMFHGTMHGAVVEKLVDEGSLDGVMMLCVHDILTEALDKYRFCNIPVLVAPAQKRVPTLISLSGMDVIDMSDREFEQGAAEFGNRKYHYHNAFCVHVKTTREEILAGGRLLAERINAFESPVTVVIPHQGFRTLTRPGEPLCDPEVDGALIAYLHEHLNSNVRIVDVDCNANDEEYSVVCAQEMERLMQ